jgi:hypothetical protein
MAAITILTPEQLAERRQKPKGRTGRKRSEERTHIIERYKAMMQGAQPGYGADVFLTEGEEKRFVRQNLKAAAAEQNLAVEFRPVKDPARLHMRFISLEEQAAKPKRGGGRPRKRDQARAELAEGNGDTDESADATDEDEDGEASTDVETGAGEEPATPARRRTRRAEAQES